MMNSKDSSAFGFAASAVLLDARWLQPAKNAGVNMAMATMMDRRRERFIAIRFGTDFLVLLSVAKLLLAAAALAPQLGVSWQVVWLRPEESEVELRQPPTWPQAPYSHRR